MIALDTSALVAIFRREEDAGVYRNAILKAGRTVMSSVTYLEASIVLAGRTGTKETHEALDRALSAFQTGVADFDEEQARIARMAYLRYGKGRHEAGLNFGDCASYAMARSRGIPLLYKGNDFARTDVNADFAEDA